MVLLPPQSPLHFCHLSTLSCLALRAALLLGELLAPYLGLALILVVVHVDHVYDDLRDSQQEPEHIRHLQPRNEHGINIQTFIYISSIGARSIDRSSSHTATNRSPRRTP